jgi:starch synthase (maltosyl-transferring)
MNDAPQSRRSLAAISEPDLSGRRFFIEDVYPAVEGGRYPAKRVVGERVEVWADIFRDGHEVIAAALHWRDERDERWRSEPMSFYENDRWRGSFTPAAPGRHVFAIEAWTDAFATWRRDFVLKRDAGLDVSLELREGRDLIEAAIGPGGSTRAPLRQALRAFERAQDPEILLQDEVARLMVEAQARPDRTWSVHYPVTVDRERAVFGSWYEIFPRGQGAVAGRHGTFDDCIARLPEIAGLGFDVL